MKQLLQSRNQLRKKKKNLVLTVVVVYIHMDLVMLPIPISLNIVVVKRKLSNGKLSFLVHSMHICKFFFYTCVKMLVILSQV